MAKKIVIKLHMASDKCRSKAMALVASTGGVVSVELAGDDKSKFVVVGEGVDSIKLTNALRKKFDGSAQLVEVGEVKKEEKKKEEEKKPVAVYQPAGYYYYPSTSSMYHCHGCPCGCNPKPDSTCSIM